MIKKLSFISVFILLFATAGVSAQDGGDRPAERNNGLDQRVTERLKRLDTNLNDNQIRVIEARCKAAQNKLKALRKVAEVYSSTQNERVDKILDNLARLSENLKSQGMDAGSIDKNIREIKQLEENISSTYEDYLLAIDDSATINCQTSPEGFRLSVDDAKGQFSDLRELRNSLRDLIKVELRQTLTDIRNNL